MPLGKIKFVIKFESISSKIDFDFCNLKNISELYDKLFWQFLWLHWGIYDSELFIIFFDFERPEIRKHSIKLSSTISFNIGCSKWINS